MKSTTEMLMEFVADNSNGSRHVGCTEERSRAHPWSASAPGFTLIELMIIIAIIAAIAIPNLLRARASANESSAISSLRTLVSSQALFFQTEDKYATSLQELLDVEWSRGTLQESVSPP